MHCLFMADDSRNKEMFYAQFVDNIYKITNKSLQHQKYRSKLGKKTLIKYISSIIWPNIERIINSKYIKYNRDS